VDLELVTGDLEGRLRSEAVLGAHVLSLFPRCFRLAGFAINGGHKHRRGMY
jgi:hypothetical protein